MLGLESCGLDHTSLGVSFARLAAYQSRFLPDLGNVEDPCRQFFLAVQHTMHSTQHAAHTHNAREFT